MIDRLAFIALDERDDLALRPGTAWSVHYVDARALSRIYPAALAAMRRHVRDLVAKHAHNNGYPNVTRDDVNLTVVTADEMRDAWKRHAPMDPPPMPVDAWIAHWTPPEVHP